MRRESSWFHRHGGRGRLLREAVAVMIMIAVVGVFLGGLAGAADPDFSSVSDILGGKRYLLRQDDLVFTSTQVENSVHQTAAAILQSKNSTLNFTETVQWGFTHGVNSAHGNSRTAVGRMFDASLQPSLKTVTQGITSSGERKSSI